VPPDAFLRVEFRCIAGESLQMGPRCRPVAEEQPEWDIPSAQPPTICCAVASDLAVFAGRVSLLTRKVLQPADAGGLPVLRGVVYHRPRKNRTFVIA
jgi:hypothetical protein